MESWAEFLPSNSESCCGPGLIPGGFRNLISTLRLGVCPLCCLWRLPWHSADHRFQGGPPLCVCLVFCFKVSALLRALTHGNLGCKFWGIYVLHWGGRKEEIYNADDHLRKCYWIQGLDKKSWQQFDISDMALFTGVQHLYTFNICLLQCQPTALLRASSSAQGGQMGLSVVYFQFTHR